MDFNTFLVDYSPALIGFGAFFLFVGFLRFLLYILQGIVLFLKRNSLWRRF
jgi:hypothetical protein